MAPSTSLRGKKMKSGARARLHSPDLPIPHFSLTGLKKARNERQYAKRIPRKTIEKKAREVLDLGGDEVARLIARLEGAAKPQAKKRIRIV